MDTTVGLKLTDARFFIELVDWFANPTTDSRNGLGKETAALNGSCWLICTVKQGMKAMPKPHTTCNWMIMEMNGLGQIGNPVSPVQGAEGMARIRRAGAHQRVGPPSISGSLPF